MNKPPIKFIYSDVYDKHCRDYIECRFPQFIDDYPDVDKIKKFIKKVEESWNGIEDKVIKEIADISDLKWEEKEIYCYVVGNCISFSNPMTIKVFNSPDRFIDVLVHEIIHRIFVQEGNYKKMKKFYFEMEKKYNDESRITKIHIPLGAVHTHIYLKFFSKERLEKDIRISSEKEDYKKAWDIVNKEGYKNILQFFK